jgi:two-component system phosphate regulon sensor histidine kinase PhoR
MSLARRLLLGAVMVVSLLVAAVVLLAGRRLQDRLVDEKVDELRRDAQLVATEWRTGVDADALAHRAGTALGYRVTLIDSLGVVQGDADFPPAARRRLENHAMRPEVLAARATGTGTAHRTSASAGDPELYVAVRHPLGVVRVALSTRSLDDIVSGARGDVLTAGLLALAGVMVLVFLFARSISQPVVELRDVAQAIASGDLSQRPALSAPGEIGDLATALSRMSEQLQTRLDALAADEQLMRAVLESLEEGVLAIDDRGTVVRINERGRALLGVAADLPFPVAILPRDPVLRAAMDLALAGDSPPATETAVLDRTVAIAARPLQIGGAVVTVLDLTVVRRLETIRRDFVANVSHELKTPLTAVSGYAETLLDESIPPAQRRAFVGTIRENAIRMQRIVDDLLDLSRIESGGWRPRVGAVDLAAIADEVLEAVRPAARAKGLALLMEMADDPAVLRADPTAVRQIVSNLLENAIRYTKDGVVTLRTTSGEEGVRIEVSDTGIGIAPEHLPRIFERFYRVDAGRSRDEGGTGLGLAIVRHLAEAHGGRIEATSTLGSGTTISVLFPTERSAAE